jgi:heat shock protein HslJ
MKKFFLAVMIIGTIVSCSPKLAPDSYWGDRRWVLSEMKGVPVQLSGTRRDAFLEFIPAEKRFTGNGGCNRINGQYSLEKKDRIRFENVISTKMSCNDIAFETSFLSLLNEVDRFKMVDNVLVLRDDNDVILKFVPGNMGSRSQ